MHLEKLKEYGFLQIGVFSISENEFKIEIDNESMTEREKCIYAFVIDGKFIRIGSSKRPLKFRLKDWRRDVSKALEGKKSKTKPPEARAWMELLIGGKKGKIFAREGTKISTPIGIISAYLDEESVLIGRYSPSLCNDAARHN